MIANSPRSIRFGNSIAQTSMDPCRMESRGDADKTPKCQPPRETYTLPIGERNIAAPRNLHLRANNPRASAMFRTSARTDRQTKY